MCIINSVGILTGDILMIIEKKQWSICSICQEALDSIVNRYGGSGIYKSVAFKKHLKNDHNITLDEYFIEKPICPCGKCNKKLGVTIRGANIRYKKMACGRNDGVMAWSENAKKERLGNKNPMFNKIPWNKGLSKETSSSINRTSEKLKNKIVSNLTKQKQSESAKKRVFHGHTGKKHSEETKNKLRLNTLRLIESGRFINQNTLPCRLFQKLLVKLNINFIREKVVSYWSFDFYIPDKELYIEVDGDYFHSNPKIYPSGPKTSTQKRNATRDIKKNLFCKSNNMSLIRFWESEIIGDIECVQQKLLNALK